MSLKKKKKPLSGFSVKLLNLLNLFICLILALLKLLMPGEDCLKMHLRSWTLESDRIGYQYQPCMF